MKELRPFPCLMIDVEGRSKRAACEVTVDSGMLSRAQAGKCQGAETKWSSPPLPSLSGGKLCQLRSRLRLGSVALLEKIPGLRNLN